MSCKSLKLQLAMSDKIERTFLFLFSLLRRWRCLFCLCLIIKTMVSILPLSKAIIFLPVVILIAPSVIILMMPFRVTAFATPLLILLIRVVACILIMTNIRRLARHIATFPRKSWAIRAHGQIGNHTTGSSLKFVGLKSLIAITPIRIASWPLRRTS